MNFFMLGNTTRIMTYTYTIAFIISALEFKNV